MLILVRETSSQTKFYWYLVLYIMCYLTFDFKNWHFFPLVVIPILAATISTIFDFFVSSSTYFDGVIKSSTYVSTSPSYIISRNTSKINLPKLARPTHKPNGVLRNLYWPLCFINYVYLVLPFGTWKNPFSSRLLSIFLIAIICLAWA